MALNKFNIGTGSMIVSFVHEYRIDNIAEFIQIASEKGSGLDIGTVYIAKEYIEGIWQYAERHNTSYWDALGNIDGKTNSAMSGNNQWL